MCGIAGIIAEPGQEVAASLATPLLGILRHRGPDDLGWLVAGPQGVRAGRGLERDARGETLLAHRRLSILDLSDAGWQPMSSADGRHHLVYNGEIYNYVELRDELARQGHVFHSQSDTEVVLRALMHWGVAALPRFVGMFALALLDRQARVLTLARDPFGIKPLYLARCARGLAFASEVKALLDLPGVSRKGNPQRIFEYLAWGRADDGPEGMLAGVRRLPAAHYQQVSLDAPLVSEARAYWKVNVDETLDISFDEAKRRVRDLFVENVRLHLRSDVPVGAALSGGIDSSAIVAVMRSLAPKLELHTFSYIADEQAVCEEDWVDLAARQAGAIAHKVRAGPGELVEDLPHLIFTQDEPFGSTSIYAQDRVFRLAREQGIKVMLDGQGADEMLGGYRHYLASRLASLLARGQVGKAWSFLRQVRRLPGASSFRAALQALGMLLPTGLKSTAKTWLRGATPRWLNAAWARDVGVRPMSDQPLQGPHKLRRHLLATLTDTSLPSLLRYEDRNSMAHSIESRVPFLTPALAELLLRLPEEYLISPEGTTKHVFREAMRGLAPDAILDRKDKIGFATPEQAWLTTLAPWVRETLHGEAAHALPMFHLPALHEEWAQVRKGERAFDFRVWRWLNFIRWAERFGVDCGAKKCA